MHAHLFHRIIDVDRRSQSDCARKYVASACTAQCVLLGQQGQPVAAQAVKPRVAKVHDMGLAPAQNQSSECGRHVLQCRVVAPHRMRPAIDRFETACARLLYALQPPLAQIEVDEAADAQFGGHPAPLCPAHAIGNRSDDPGPCTLFGRPDIDSGVILVLRAGPLLGAKADPDLKAAGRELVGHCRRTPAIATRTPAPGPQRIVS
jgi:hypothetical protein